MSIFKTKHPSTLVHVWLLILRLSVAGFMLTHGYPKFMRFFEAGELSFADPIGIGAVPSLILVVFAEFLCSIFIALGLGTRLAAIPLIVAMSVAAFITHAADPFGKQEKALLYLLIYITLLIFGSGKFSFDKWWLKK